ncbi:MAG TPA: hypothetical protein VFZ09_25120 [Archangium sp.]|uniref:hypothetical protein n=1 Tax=Archangium sp. TaxID=1872627 RepID=UPI002E308B2A|nr:hypothetical protein [Archangium sp.]HEX5749535.1 hypothetical protein [Archangium sp.]
MKVSTQASTRASMKRAALLLVVGLALLPERALAQQRLCFPEATALPGEPATPTVDGKVQGDMGWSSAFRYVFENASPGPHGALQGLRTPSDFFLSIEVNGDTGFDEDDTVVLALHAVGSDQYWRIHIRPLPPGVGDATNSAPQEVLAWKATSTTPSVDWSQTTASANPPWLQVRTATSGAETARKAWNVEVRLPRASQEGLTLSGVEELDFYVAAFVAMTGTPGSKGTALVWPRGAPAPDIDNPLTSTPPSTTWGRAYLREEDCGGVTLAADGLRLLVGTEASAQVSQEQSNRFTATVQNKSVDAARIAAAAEGLSATFRISNEGITDPDYERWQIFPAPGNPTAPMTLPAEATETLATGEWTLTEAQQGVYARQPKQVVLVELDASPGSGTYITRRSATREVRFAQGGNGGGGGGGLLGIVAAIVAALGALVFGLLKRGKGNAKA